MDRLKFSLEKTRDSRVDGERYTVKDGWSGTTKFVGYVDRLGTARAAPGHAIADFLLAGLLC